MNELRRSGLAASIRAVRARLREVPREPEQVRAAAIAAVVVLVVAGAILPPISLATRLTSIGYTSVRAGVGGSVRADTGAARLDIAGGDVHGTSRVRLRSIDFARAPRALRALPDARVVASPLHRLDLRGSTPRRATLVVPVPGGAERQPYIDPYGWDGRHWRWLPVDFPTADRARVQLDLTTFVPQWVVLTAAMTGRTEVSAALLPPPAAVPAAMAELPILELRAYHLAVDDGTVVGQAFAVPSQSARRIGVVDNLDGTRVRSDLLGNILIRPEVRHRHRQAIVDVVRRDRLDGVVLDYREVPDDLASVYADFVRRLGVDLHAREAELVVTVPMPIDTTSGWTAVDVPWQSFATGVDGVRVRLPNDRPLQVDALDGMVRWALGRVERDALQLAVPAQVRDEVQGEVRAIGYAEALEHVLDMAASDAPARLTPGEMVSVELPTIRAAEFGRDEGTGMWRFFYWDGNRRQHVVWLIDASGLQPALAIASRYHLGRIALDGVSAGIDPSLWQMVRGFMADGGARAPVTDYRLSWRLLDGRGQVVQEASNRLETATFEFRAPVDLGVYHLGVNLVTSDGRTAALGRTRDVRVAAAPPPTPQPTVVLFYVEPTPVPYLTAPAPVDEQRLQRTPIRVDASAVASTGTPTPPDARVVTAEGALRSAPDIAADVVSDLRAGDALEVTGRTRSGTWLLVRVVKTGIEGWVLADLLRIEIALSSIPVVTEATSTPTAARR